MRARSRATPALGLLLAALHGGPAPAEGRPPVAVEAVTITLGPLVETVSAVGELRSNESVVVRPEIDGRISAIQFREGAAVAASEVLVRLDDSIQRAELAEARARLGLSRSTYDRQQETYRRGHTSQQALDEALAQVRVNEAAVQLAQARVQKTTIVAPFTGIIGLRNVSVGSYVEAGDDITNLESLDPLKIDFQVPERYLRAIREGGSVEVHLDAFPQRTYTGTIYAIDPRIDRQNRSVAVRANLPNPEGVLRAGLFARIQLIVDERRDAVLVPEEALIPRGDRRYVYRVVDGQARFTEVSLGLRRTGYVEIVSGLEAGDVVITAGHAKVREGAAVRILGPGSAGGPLAEKSGS